ncbi:uncharacterized protein RAG0_15983 [Rhynchosporium agropyri]|uniref:C2H2-type domain-containing protein n=1 Tax=Rhynchosporium agropyri TaxID=914238 RepID=A0A1E1LNC9_9HELO|nr:uncharacterized protein RAG0_15983 [Rhynchosporium agropyri]
MTSRCVLCDRSFNSDESLREHKRASPAHHTFDCRSCDRHFGSEQALQQHLSDSPVHAVHAPSFDCGNCYRSFDGKEALQQHLHDVHAPSFNCETCDRSFSNEEALHQHLRDSRIHQMDTESPLDVFFRSFPAFDYDPSLPPATSYANLQRQEGWGRGSAASNEAWNGYQDSLQGELHLWYGAENDLTAWHALCRPIGIEPLPKTCEQCEEVGGLQRKSVVSR